jgi:SPP1 gp7 family putative phage head morphogenesis protein
MSDEEIDKLIQGVYSGDISLFSLPESVFLYNFNTIQQSIEYGFGQFLEGSRKWERMQDYRQNNFVFSGAKTFQEVKDLSMFVFDEKAQKRPFREFRDFALEINNKYNVNWLRTEQNIAFGMAQAADNWFTIEEEAEILPYLQYKTVNDGRVRPLHMSWHNITLRFDDPFWNTRFPPNEFGCRCRVIQLGEAKSTNLRQHLVDFNRKQRKLGLETVDSLDNDSKLFNVNPGKVNYIFDEKTHPYFKVEKRFSPMLKDNFGFKMPA